MTVRANFDLPMEPDRALPINCYPIRSNFGLLPETEKNPASFFTSTVVNLTMLALAVYVGMSAKHVIQQHRYEQTQLIFPTTPLPEPVKMKVSPSPKIERPKLPEIKLDAPKINMAKLDKKADLRPIQIETKTALPLVKSAKSAVILAPQPKAALTAATPAQVPQAHPSTAPVHLGETFGVTPNSNATRSATVAAIGNPYGGMQSSAMPPHGVVGSAGSGNEIRSGSDAGVVGNVSSAGIPGGTAAPTYGTGKVALVGISAIKATITPAPAVRRVAKSTDLEVISKPPVQYTTEARALRVQGNVILRVTFTAAGQVLVQGVVHGLGHGLDEEACRAAQQIRFHPATRNGQAVDLATQITITFQLA